MTIERSYGRILWNDNAPVLHVVNPSGQQFTLQTEPILNLYRNLECFVKIKSKSKKQNCESGQYLGEIYGSIDKKVFKKQFYLLLTIFIGEPSKSLTLTSDNELSDVIEVQEYCFPKIELIRFIRCIDAMYTQATHYTMLKMNIDVIFPGESSLLCINKV